MASPDRPSLLDASFLHIENADVAHARRRDLPRIGAAMSDFLEHIALDHVPRYRQRLASVSFGQGRAVWVEDAPDPAVTS